MPTDPTPRPTGEDAEWDDLNFVRALVHDLRHSGGKLANASDPNKKRAGRAAGELAVLALNAADCIAYLANTILVLGEEREKYKAALLEELAPPELSDDEAAAAIEAWAGPMPRFTATGSPTNLPHVCPFCDGGDGSIGCAECNGTGLTFSMKGRS